VSSGGSIDNITIGTKEEAKDGYDFVWDCFEPPSPIDGRVKAYFVKDSKSEFGNKFDIDIKSPIGVGKAKVWEFVVETQNSKVKSQNLSGTKIPVIVSKNQNLKTKNCVITWPCIEGVPEGISIILIDGGRRIDLRKNKSYSCTIKGRHKFRIEVTNNGNLDKKYKWALYNPFPNPFMDRVRISYSLAKKGYVSLRIYDVSGRLVKTLADGIKEAGLYSIEVGGEGLVSGVYFIKFKAGDFCSTKKLLLLK
jgi:hypothetical protein